MAKVSALGSATRKTSSGGAKVPEKDVYLATDVRDFNNPGEILFTKDDVANAIKGYVEGDALEDQGEALKKLHKPTIMAFGMTEYARHWANAGVEPQNSPKLLPDANAEIQVQFIPVDREKNLDEQQYVGLANLIGAASAEANTIRRDDILFNQDHLAQVVSVKGEDKTVLALIDEAISEKFSKMGREDLLTGLFEIKPVFRTKKGLLAKALALVGNGTDKARKLVEFFEKANVTISLKSGSTVAKK